MPVPERPPSWLHLLFAGLGVALLAVFAWVFLQEYFAEWRITQATFRELQAEKKAPGTLSLSPPVDGIRQVWLPDLGRIDRCSTCHLGADDPTFVSTPQPFTTHSGTWLESHPPDRFGCTACHGGQGEATTYREAAHDLIPHWPEPIRTGELIEASCGACHQERRQAAAFTLSAGRDLIAEAGCVACHDIPGFTLDDLNAPRLDSVGYKVRPDWLRGWLEAPERYLSEARMPNFRLDPAEVESLSAFLLSQKATPLLDSSAVDWSAADSFQGRVIFGEARCVSCHMIDERGGTLGPDLSTIGSKVGRDWLFSYIKDPMHDQPQTLMLRYQFSDEEARDLVSYLMEELIDLDAAETAPAVGNLDPTLVEAGRERFVHHGCQSCHPVGGTVEPGKIGPSLDGVGGRHVESSEFHGETVVPDLANWLFLKLREPDRLTEESLMPTYPFTDQEAASVVVALLSLTAQDLPSSRVTNKPRPTPYEPQGRFGTLVAEYRCLSCHELRGWGSQLSTVPLDRIGSQLQRSHLVSYFERPFAVRVSIEERMPYFRMTREEAETLADYFATVYVDDALERPVELDLEAARRGETLFADHGCGGCHIVGGTGGYVGPDLGNTAERLKPGWIEEWLLRPNEWKPGTLQPDYGLTGQDARDLTAYLMTLSTTNAAGVP